MTYPDKGYGQYGPDPWPQTSWDARAAGNFVFGGMGAGLVVVGVLSGAAGTARAALLLAGAALVGVGLFCVALELGRPLRALNVFRNPRTSWMSREAWASALLMPAVLGAVAGITAMIAAAVALALVFVYCQSRLLQGAKGIPAWREPMVRLLVVVTGLAEGGGAFLVAAPWHGLATPAVLVLVGGLVLSRYVVWTAYRRRVAGTLAPGAVTALDHTGHLLRIAGTAAPLVLLALAGAGTLGARGALPAVAVAGALAAFAGAHLKFTLVTRAGFNQGFALPHLPVRGTRS